LLRLAASLGDGAGELGLNQHLAKPGFRLRSELHSVDFKVEVLGDAGHCLKGLGLHANMHHLVGLDGGGERGARGIVSGELGHGFSRLRSSSLASQSGDGSGSQ
jgi:hypothetical protein